MMNLRRNKVELSLKLNTEVSSVDERPADGKHPDTSSVNSGMSAV